MSTFISPVKIHFGEGCVRKISDECQALGVRRVIVFADPFLVTSGAISKVEHILSEHGIEYSVYDQIVPEPPVAIGDQAVDAVRNSGAELVIAVGGGSALDIAKAAAVLATHEGSIADYLNLTGTRKLQHKGLPKILIPTTSGTGSEVTDIAVFNLESTKDVITHNYLLADVAIVDPEFTYSVPPRVTAATGVDAFTHALEAYTSIQSSTLTDALALEAMDLIAKKSSQSGMARPRSRGKKSYVLGEYAGGNGLLQCRDGRRSCAGLPARRIIPYFTRGIERSHAALCV